MEPSVFYFEYVLSEIEDVSTDPNDYKVVLSGFFSSENKLIASVKLNTIIAEETSYPEGGTSMIRKYKKLEEIYDDLPSKSDIDLSRFEFDKNEVIFSKNEWKNHLERDHDSSKTDTIIYGENTTVEDSSVFRTLANYELSSGKTDTIIYKEFRDIPSS